MERISDADLGHIHKHTEELWHGFKNQTIFITGGTGFFGKWLLSSFIYINAKENLESKLIILTRNKNAFLSEYPFYLRPELEFIEGEIEGFDFPEHQIDYIIHAATEASATLNIEKPLQMYNTIVEGTKRILELAKQKKVKAVLHTSSGAVYGEQPSEITHITEDYFGAPDVLASGSAYGEGKRVAEMMACIYYRTFGVPSKIARCYAFAGPYLPLNASYAFGNFILDLINKRDIIIKGDGTTYRSYMYASDLTVWLWTILFKAEPCRPVNVGSDVSINLAGLANEVSLCSDVPVSVKILKKADPLVKPMRYVPSVNRAKTELGLNVQISLSEAIKKTMQFYQ